MKSIIRFNRKDKIKRIVLPGFEGATLSNVFQFVVKGFGKGVLVTRASSIADCHNGENLISRNECTL